MCLEVIRQAMPGQEQTLWVAVLGWAASLAVIAIFSNSRVADRLIDSSRGVPVGPIQDGGDTEFFEIRDSEGHLIEICKEP